MRRNRRKKRLSYLQAAATNLLIGCTLGGFVGLLAIRVIDALPRSPAESCYIAAAEMPADRPEMPVAEVVKVVAEVVEEQPEEMKEETKEETGPQLVSLGTFRATAYCPCLKCCGKTDGITATGTQATQGRTIAVDPDVIPYGTTVYIDGVPYVAEDCGGAIKENRIDVFFYSHADALEFGVQTKELYIMEG